MLLCFRSNLHKAHIVRFYFTIQSDGLLLNESFIVIIAIFTLISIILFSVLCLPYFFTFLIFLEFINFIFHFFPLAGLEVTDFVSFILKLPFNF